MTEIIGAIRAALADASTQVGAARYFGVPSRPATGPLKDYVIVTYRGGRDPQLQETLVRRHDAYVDCLRLAGLRVPETEIRLLNDTGTLTPVIVQRAVPEDIMLPALFVKAGPEAAIGLLDQAAAEVAEFWRRVAQRPERIGLHAQIERFGMGENGLVFLDTFPPLISYDRAEMGQVIQRFADSGLIRGLGKILPGRVRDVQDRWYTPAGSISTLLDGALRLRPQDTERLMDWATGFATSRLEGPWRAALHVQLARTARLHSSARGVLGGLKGRDRPHA